MPLLDAVNRQLSLKLGIFIFRNNNSNCIIYLAYLRFAGSPEPGFPLKPQFPHTLRDKGCSTPHSGQGVVCSGNAVLHFKQVLAAG
jgi:hypothetical protein